MTHLEIIKKHLDAGHVLTRHVAAGTYWIHELSNRMAELEATGYKIKRKKVTRTNMVTKRTVTFTEYRKA